MGEICSFCNSSNTSSVIEFDDLSLSNRYYEFLYSIGISIKLYYCNCCSHVYILPAVESSVIKSPHDWLVYNEPEVHLDNVCFELSKLLPKYNSFIVGGISYKDDTLINRIESANDNANCRRIKYCGGKAENYSIDEVQYMVSHAMFDKEDGLYDVLIARHIIEHSYNIRGFLSTLKNKLTPEGLLLIEYPCSRKIFDKLNYPFIWEEHLSYFFEEDADRIAALGGLELVYKGVFDSSYENSVVVIYKNNKLSSLGFNPYDKKNLLQKFSHNFEYERDKWHQLLESYDPGSVVLFGGGHLSVRFISMYSLSDLVSVVVDDDSNKNGCYLPGTSIPIVSSRSIDPDAVQLCISTLSPESFARVKSNNEFMKRCKNVVDAFN